MRYDSVLDPENRLPIDPKNWVVAIVRKPKGRNPEHAFILVEGIDEADNVTLRRYDLFMDEANSEKFKINMKEDKFSYTDNDVRKKLLDFIGREEVSGKCWSIKVRDADKLEAIVKDSKNNPGKYNLLGDAATAPHTAEASRATLPGAEATTKATIKSIESVSEENSHSAVIAQYSLEKPPGESCFTWARNVLVALNNEVITKELPSKPLDMIISITSRHLGNSESVSEKKCSIM